MITTISNLTVLRPAFELDQEESVHWLAQAHVNASRGNLSHEEVLTKLKKVALGDQKIRKRGVSIRDGFHRNWDEMEVYKVTQKPSGACFGKRSEVFDRVATDKLQQFYPEGAPLPSHLIHVTCTGYVAPSPAQKLISMRNAGSKTQVTHAYHMGCYASIPALRIAQGFSSHVDVVHTELCTLHLNPELHDTSQLVVQTLFADGFIKYTVQPGGKGFQILALNEVTVPETLHMMEWVCKEWGLQMTLTKEVPVEIARALPVFVANLFKQAGVPEGSKIHYAIHPGGPRIIQQVAKILELDDSQVEHSLFVLQNYGNMSSATLPHVWEKLWKDDRVKDGAYVVSLAFGPGLTLAGGVFQCAR